MDLSTIKDVNELKALAFDQIQALEQAQANLRMIQQRLAEVQQEAAKAKPSTTK